MAASFADFLHLSQRRARMLLVALARLLNSENAPQTGATLLESAMKSCLRLAEKPSSPRSAIILQAQRRTLTAYGWQTWNPIFVAASGACSDDPLEWMAGDAQAQSLEVPFGAALAMLAGCFAAAATPLMDPAPEALYCYALSEHIPAPQAAMLGDLALRLGEYSVSDHLHGQIPCLGGAHPRGCWALDILIGRP